VAVVRVVSLAWKHRRHAVAPDLLYHREDAQLVIYHDIVPGRIARRDRIEHLFFMDVDQHPAFHRRPEPGALDLARLEHHVAIRQNDRQSPGA